MTGPSSACRMTTSTVGYPSLCRRTRVGDHPSSWLAMSSSSACGSGPHPAARRVGVTAASAIVADAASGRCASRRWKHCRRYSTSTSRTGRRSTAGCRPRSGRACCCRRGLSREFLLPPMVQLRARRRCSNLQSSAGSAIALVALPCSTRKESGAVVLVGSRSHVRRSVVAVPVVVPVVVCRGWTWSITSDCGVASAVSAVQESACAAAAASSVDEMITAKVFLRMSGPSGVGSFVTRPIAGVRRRNCLDWRHEKEARLIAVIAVLLASAGRIP